MQSTLDELTKIIDETASKEASYQIPGEVTIYDLSGGNYDDAYSIGLEDGEIWFAQRLKKVLDKR